VKFASKIKDSRSLLVTLMDSINLISSQRMFELPQRPDSEDSRGTVVRI
jgi:hypothetical protein